MSQAAIRRGKEIIKDAIRKTPRGEVARIPVADQSNLTVFQQALRQHDIQRMLIQKGVSVEFDIPLPPVEQAKNHMLQAITNAPDEIQEIVFPVLSQDYADAEIALASVEVQQALHRRNITASLTRTTNKPEIVIATYDQAISGELNRYLRRYHEE